MVGIGDPTLSGWLVTAGYFLAGMCCLWAAWRSRLLPGSRQSARAVAFWMACSLAMLFLCINKQLDLQTLFTQIGRDMAKSEGWYDGRRVVQSWFIGAMIAIGIGVTLFSFWFVRGTQSSAYLGLVGLIFTGCFVVIRASSFHHVDSFLGYVVAGVDMNWILETGGFMIVGASALSASRRPAGGAISAPADDESHDNDLGEEDNDGVDNDGDGDDDDGDDLPEIIIL
tara:strand:- start:863 stop:1543 length:681 start_codon:yes stop_codon:yes gene_type:complete